MSATRDAGGFTLLEVMIAGVLLSILGACTYAAFMGSHQLLLAAQYRLEAMNAARRDLETLEASSYDGLETTTLPALPGTLNRTLTITAPAAPGGSKTITVRMTRSG